MDLASHLGADLVSRLFSVPLETWTGPLDSKDGVHYVRVEARTLPAQVPFEEAVEQLRAAWTVGRQREAIARRTAGLVTRYRVYVEGEE